MSDCQNERGQVDLSRLPRHIAIIMDGNGRWAKQRGLPRTAGHKAGAENFRRIATYCKNLGVQYLTVYAFSTENWKRSETEVSAIMALLKTYLLEAVDTMERDHIRLHFFGDMTPIDPELRALAKETDEITEHHMHSEFCMLSAETAKVLNRTRQNGGRIICVGTTSCRTLESLAEPDGTFTEKSAWTDIFIYPGYRFRAMDALITNFHLPESTLIMLVSAFAGYDHVMHAYHEAVESRYRFFSFGDAMFIE